MSRTAGGEPASAALRARRRAREAALQMLYQCEVGRVTPEEAIAAQAAIEPAVRPASPEGERFASRLVTGTVGRLAEIDPLIAACAEHWRPERMAVIDRLILRMAVYQLLHEPDVPAAVAIDEAIELARRFGGEESGRFVNGVLDAVRRRQEGGGAG
jgi:N utilization substance protein B